MTCLRNKQKVLDDFAGLLQLTHQRCGQDTSGSFCLQLLKLMARTANMHVYLSKCTKAIRHDGCRLLVDVFHMPAWADYRVCSVIDKGEIQHVQMAGWSVKVFTSAHDHVAYLPRQIECNVHMCTVSVPTVLAHLKEHVICQHTVSLYSSGSYNPGIEPQKARQNQC